MLALAPALMAKPEWPPIDPADLAMKSYPGRPGDAAVILDKSVHCDDKLNSDTYFMRIKVLTEAGKDSGSIHIIYDQRNSKVGEIKARTIEPDGTIVPFNGKVFDSVVEKARDRRSHQKTFSMPEVKVGSIIDVQYTIFWHDNLLPAVAWDVQSHLFIRHESFFIRPNPDYRFFWITQGLDRQHQPVRHEHPYLTVTLEDTNVPPLDREPYSLPRENREQRVVVFYSLDEIPKPAEFWKKFRKKNSKDAEKFIHPDQTVKDALAKIVQDSDNSDVKLHKIFAWVESLRNLSNEDVQPGGIKDFKDLKDNKNAGDVLTHGYGWGNELNETFVALARAAGFKAWYVLTSSRDGEFFSMSLPDGTQMSGDLAEVEVDGKPQFFDAGWGCPYGVISWTQTGVAAIQLNRKGGTFITTSVPMSGQSERRRTGDFTLSADGTLKGELHVSFTGDEAFEHTIAALTRDETANRKHLLDEVRGWLPNTADVKLETVNGWKTSEPELDATFSVKIPGFAIPAGSRLLLPQGLLEATAGPMFSAPQRKGMIYFDEPWSTVDDVRIHLPSGFRVESTPKPSASPATSALRYDADSTFTAGQNLLHWQRQLAVDGFIFPPKLYPALRSFFDFVRHNDQLQVVLQAETRSAQLVHP